MCYEGVNEIGPNPRRFTCPMCNKKKWRNIYSYQYVMTHGCNVCRLKAKYKPIIEEKIRTKYKTFCSYRKSQKLTRATGRYYEAEI